MNSKKETGITLIALVITIIVLLILAGVTISMVLGDDGIIANAQAAKNANEQAVKDEEDALDELMLQMNDNLDSEGDPEEAAIILKNQDGTETVTYKDTLQEVIKESFKNNNNSIDALEEIWSESDYEEIPDKVALKAKEDGYLIKLNQTTYLSEKVEQNTKQVIVIDLNGNKLVCSGEASFIASGRTGGEIYIVDSSEPQTGIVKILQEENKEYKYVEKCDTNGDGVVCQDDEDFIVSGYRIAEGDENWEKYKKCDINGSKIINMDDISEFFSIYGGYKYKPHIDTVFTGDVYFGIKKEAIVTKCNCNDYDKINLEIE